jgi:hypothetical protein
MLKYRQNLKFPVQPSTIVKIKLSGSLIFILFFYSCINSSTCEFIGSSQISKSLFLERYKTFDAGVWGERIDCFITDSINFRKNVGFYDEHEFLFARLVNSNIEVYNVQSLPISDTLETKAFSKMDLYKSKYSNSSCLNAIPVFGINNITCDNNYHEASSYKKDNGHFMTEIQYKCGSKYLNALYYTDSSKFRVFVGVYDWSNLTNIYSVNLGKDSIFYFYNVKEKHKTDTVKHVTYALADLKKGPFIKGCK